MTSRTAGQGAGELAEFDGHRHAIDHVSDLAVRRSDVDAADNKVALGYFSALGIPLIAGREFIGDEQ